jgi:Mg2+/Co2+ transporter CorB
VLGLEKVIVDDIMVLRNEIIGIDANGYWKLIMRQLTNSSHSRIILYRSSLDAVLSA